MIDDTIPIMTAVIREEEDWPPLCDLASSLSSSLLLPLKKSNHEIFLENNIEIWYRRREEEGEVWQDLISLMIPRMISCTTYDYIELPFM